MWTGSIKEVLVDLVSPGLQDHVQVQVIVRQAIGILLRLAHRPIARGSRASRALSRPSGARLAGKAGSGPSPTGSRVYLSSGACSMAPVTRTTSSATMCREGGSPTCGRHAPVMRRENGNREYPADQIGARASHFDGALPHGVL